MHSEPNIEKSLTDFSHTIDAQLRFNDIDRYGHVNNNAYLQLFDLGKLNYFQDVLGSDYVSKEFSAVIVNINCDFMSPAFLSDELQIATSVVGIGEKSFTVEQMIFEKKSHEIKCVCKTVMTWMDLKTMKSCVLPQFFINRVKLFESL